MDIATGILCDYASVREGLLFIIGGGVMRIRRPAYPAPIDCSVALLLELHQMELVRPHEIELRVQDEDGKISANVKGGFQVGEVAELGVGENVLVPFVIDLRPAALEKPGRYSIEVSLDGAHQRTMQFQALQQ